MLSHSALSKIELSHGRCFDRINFSQLLYCESSILACALCENIVTTRFVNETSSACIKIDNFFNKSQSTACIRSLFESNTTLFSFADCKKSTHRSSQSKSTIWNHSSFGSTLLHFICKIAVSLWMCSVQCTYIEPTARSVHICTFSGIGWYQQNIRYSWRHKSIFQDRVTSATQDYSGGIGRTNFLRQNASRREKPDNRKSNHIFKGFLYYSTIPPHFILIIFAISF